MSNSKVGSLLRAEVAVDGQTRSVEHLPVPNQILSSCFGMSLITLSDNISQTSIRRSKNSEFVDFHREMSSFREILLQSQRKNLGVNRISVKSGISLVSGRATKRSKRWNPALVGLFKHSNCLVSVNFNFRKFSGNNTRLFFDQHNRPRW